jgi:hypothetical protein
MPVGPARNRWTEYPPSSLGALEVIPKPPNTMKRKTLMQIVEWIGCTITMIMMWVIVWLMMAI